MKSEPHDSHTDKLIRSYRDGSDALFACRLLEQVCREGSEAIVEEEVCFPAASHGFVKAQNPTIAIGGWFGPAGS